MASIIKGSVIWFKPRLYSLIKPYWASWETVCHMSLGSKSLKRGKGYEILIEGLLGCIWSFLTKAHIGIQKRAENRVFQGPRSYMRTVVGSVL